MNGFPLKTNLEALFLAIIGKASNASILDSVMFHRQRSEKVLTIHDPMPTIRTPV
jgi:hypothetical protein